MANSDKTCYTFSLLSTTLCVCVCVCVYGLARAPRHLAQRGLKAADSYTLLCGLPRHEARWDSGRQ
jgi:hypothetical protein